MAHILDQIVAFKKKEVTRAKEVVTVDELVEIPGFDRVCNSFIERQQTVCPAGVIAEFKRRSPSKSNINLTANLEEVIDGYWTSGAAAVSVLTDNHFFGGSPEYIKRIRHQFPKLPILRKEFIIDEYQVIEAKAIGADLILLISEILTKEDVRRFASLARSLGMEVLLEMHTADQIDKYCDEVDIVGVNNRDLKTFEVDFERSKNLFDQLPKQVTKIAESGLSEVETCHMLYEYGFRGFLIGEQFMKSSQPGFACREFIDSLNQLIKK